MPPSSASSRRSILARNPGWSGGSNSIIKTARHAEHDVVTNRPVVLVSMAVSPQSRQRFTLRSTWRPRTQEPASAASVVLRGSQRRPNGVEQLIGIERFFNLPDGIEHRCMLPRAIRAGQKQHGDVD